MSIPAHIKELLANLEFIAMIEKGKKPCLSDMTFVEATSWHGALKRRQYAENKKELLNFIDGVVEQSFAVIGDPRNREYIPTIIQTLSRAKIGISNTQATYQNHPSFISRVRVILSNIDHQLKKHEIAEGTSNPVDPFVAQH
jgi:hypothetical protein